MMQSDIASADITTRLLKKAMHLLKSSIVATLVGRFHSIIW